MPKAIKLTLVIITITFAAAVCLSIQGWLPWKLLSCQDSAMSPTINSGDLVVFNRAGHLADLRAGSVVAYKTSNHKAVAVARIVRIYSHENTNNYLLKADSTDKEYQVDGSIIVGSVLAVMPVLGLIYSFATSWLGIVVCLYIPVVAIIGYEINRLAKHLANYATD